MVGVAGARGGCKGGSRTAKDRGEAGGIGILGRRHVTPRWADDPVQRHDGRWWSGCRSRRGLPPLEGHQEEGREGGA